MIWRNIKYYRVKAGKSRTGLSGELGISLKHLDNYESGEELPSLEMARRITSLLGVSFADIMLAKSVGHNYEHREYRKGSSFRKREQGYVEVAVEDYLDRFFAVVEALSDNVENVFCPVPIIHKLKPSFNAEHDALALRRELEFPLSGTIPNLTMALEDKGMLIIQLECKDLNFSGRNGLADGRPYIVVNGLTTVERQRSTIAHELVDIYFERPSVANKDWEHYMTAVSGAFLLGCETTQEKALMFEKLVLRAVVENKITVQRGAELLRMPYVCLIKRISV